MTKQTVRIRAKASDGATEVKALFSHPMETGQRKDKKTGEKVPAHYIQEVNCEHNGKNVMLADWGPAVSKNPYLSFKFKGGAKGDDVKISWADNKGQSDTVEAKIR
jgi:sulfur-oxidizing protein SoxZ